MCKILFEQKDVAAIEKKKSAGLDDLWEAAHRGSTRPWGWVACLPGGWLSLGVTGRPCVHWVSLLCFQDGGQEDSFLEMGFPPLLLMLTVFCMIKYASRGLYRRNHFLSVRLSGIQFIHTVVQPSPASISRTLFSLVKWKPCPH